MSYPGKIELFNEEGKLIPTLLPILDEEGKIILDVIPEEVAGKSAYQIAVDNGFQGTEEEWLLSLKGEDEEIQDISGKVDKVTGYSLVADSAISNFHAPGSDNQDLSNLVVKVTGSSLVQDTEISKIHSLGSDNQDLSGLQPKETGKGLSTNDYTDAEEEKLGGIETGAEVNNISDVNAGLLTGGQETTLHTHAGGGGGLGYAINVQALTSSPADGATVYFGMLPKAPITTANVSKVYIRKAGTIKIAEIYCYSGTAGTAEAWSLYIRKNNSADTLIATLSVATNERVFSNVSLSISVVAGDYIEIKGVQPTWATNPLTCIYAGYIYIE